MEDPALRGPSVEALHLRGGEGAPLEQEGREVGPLRGDHGDVIGGSRHPRPAQRVYGRDEHPQHLPRGLVLRPHDVQDPLVRQPGEVEVEGFARVEVVLREHMGRTGGAAHRVHSRKLQHVIARRLGGQEVPPLVVHEMDARVARPASEVVTVLPVQDVEGGPVHLDPGQVSGLEAKAGQKVEAAAHADDQGARMLDRGGLVGGRVDRLLDTLQRTDVAVVVHGIRERVVVLGQHAPESRQEGPVVPHEGRPREGLGVGRRSAHDLDAGDGVPEEPLEYEAAAGDLGLTEKRRTRVGHDEDPVREDAAEKDQDRGSAHGHEAPSAQALRNHQEAEEKQQAGPRHAPFHPEPGDGGNDGDGSERRARGDRRSRFAWPGARGRKGAFPGSGRRRRRAPRRAGPREDRPEAARRDRRGTPPAARGSAPGRRPRQRPGGSGRRARRPRERRGRCSRAATR